ncbi:hypothetical protein [Algivirga pacifica]|uniref:Uncharacterized protein n=1 Tax=Algivirga pacifica TaxID=1162670 RepID=A0ABP9CZN1_9BACT
MQIRLSQYGVLFLAKLMLLCAFASPLVYVDYQLRKDYISEVLCINRYEVELACAGKCYLNKQIQKSQQTEEQESIKETIPALHMIFHVLPETEDPMSRTPRLIAQTYRLKEQVLEDQYLVDILNPPRI